MSELSIRKAVPGDEDTIVRLLYELAQYEKLTDRFMITREVVTRDILGNSACLNCNLGFLEGEPVGVMTWYPIYSSFAAARGIFLEDLFVRIAHRGKGIGKALLAHLARQAAENKARYIDWFVLDWNEPSIAFYESLHAEQVKGWLSYRLSGAALAQLAGS